MLAVTNLSDKGPTSDGHPINLAQNAAKKMGRSDDFSELTPTQKIFDRLAAEAVKATSEIYRPLVEFVRTNSVELKNRANRILISRKFHPSTASKLVTIALKATDDDFKRYMSSATSFDEVYELVRKRKGQSTADKESVTKTGQAARKIVKRFIAETNEIPVEDPDYASFWHEIRRLADEKLELLKTEVAQQPECSDIGEQETNLVNSVCEVYEGLQTSQKPRSCPRLHSKVGRQIRKLAGRLSLPFGAASKIFLKKANERADRIKKSPGYKRPSAIDFLTEVASDCQV